MIVAEGGGALIPWEQVALIKGFCEASRGGGVVVTVRLMIVVVVFSTTVIRLSLEK